jgi:hypothetical protein
MAQAKGFGSFAAPAPQHCLNKVPMAADAQHLDANKNLFDAVKNLV